MKLTLTGLLSLLAAAPAFAVTDTWDGGGADNNLSTALNWLDNTAPASDLVNTDLIFDGTVRLTPNFSAVFSADSITFANNATANAFTFSGSALTIGAGGIVNNDANLETFNNTVTIGTATSTFGAASGGLAFASVSLGANAVNFTGAGAGTITSLTGSGTITKTGAGTLDIIGRLGAGAGTLNANIGDINIGEDQTLAALNIGADATVTLGTIAPGPAAQAIPKPRFALLLSTGLLPLLLRRRRTSEV
jgi:hypothetical protein